jgi:O-antigen ligase
VDGLREAVGHLGRQQGLQALAVGVVGLVVAVALEAGLDRVGLGVLVLPLVLLAAWYLLLHPAAALAALVGSTILFEEAREGYWELPTDSFYAYIGPVQPTDLLLLVTFGSVVLAGIVHQPGGERAVAVRDLGAWDLPLGVLGLATTFGFVTGWFGSAELQRLLIETKTLAYLVAIPFLAAWILPDARRRRQAVLFLAGLVLAKCTFGVLAYVVGQGIDSGAGDGQQLTYYEAPINHLSVLYLLFVAATPFAKVRPPRWVLLGTPVVFLCLALSLRRSFWIALVLALLLLLIVASGQRGRPWLAIGAVAVALGLWTVTVAGGSTDTSNPVLARAESINPSDLRSNSTDRYRLEEQRNIVEELQRHPTTGIGLGVPWTARSPLSEEHVGGRAYTHTLVLWYWLKLGPLGLVAYVWLTGLTLWSGYQVWRRGREALERCAGLALAAGTVGLAVAETTGSFTGASARFSVVLGAMLGWLASAYLDLRDDAEVAADHVPDMATSVTGVAGDGSAAHLATSARGS